MKIINLLKGTKPGVSCELFPPKQGSQLANALEIVDTIAEQKYDMTLEQAITLFKGPLKEYVAAHDGKLPSMEDPDPKVRELAVAYAKILNQKRRKLSGLEIGE